jgi:opacity protein-like surface antigen
MGSLKALTLASAVALAAIPATQMSTAYAADLLPPPPQLEPPPLRGPVEEPVGFYLRGDLGVGIDTISNLSSEITPGFVVPDRRFDGYNLGDSAVFGIGIGYKFNNWFRGDVTAEYRSSSQYNAIGSYDSTQFGGTCSNNLAVSGRCTDLYSGHVESVVVLANIYADIGTWYGVTPYVGAGLGVANIRFGSVVDQEIGDTGGGYSLPTWHTNFAWAAMAGLAYHVSPNLILEMGWRYLDQGNIVTNSIICQPLGASACPQEIQHMHLSANDLHLGMRWMMTPMYEPVPVLQTRY